MIINKLDVIKVVSGILLGGLLMFLLMREEQTTIDVPVDIDFTTPAVVVEKDTVYYPSPVYIPGKKEIDSLYYEEYVKLKDSVAKAELFQEAVTINTYNEKIEDDTLKIDLYAKTRGSLLEYKVNYKVKPQTYHIDTIISVKIPTKTKFYIGGEAIMPIDLLKIKPSIEPGLLMENKKSTKIYKLGYDPINNVGKAGIYFRL